MKKDVDPRMHSAEHILNQTMVRLFNCGRSFNAHIEKKKSKCDYRFDRDLTDEEMSQIENQVNTVIQKNLPITEDFTSRDEAEKQYNPGRLPQDAAADIRIVKIGDYDACPCIGTHATSTKEIGAFRIISSSFNRGALRIRFRLD